MAARPRREITAGLELAPPYSVGLCRLKGDLRAMLKPYDPKLMKSNEVSRAVNSVKNDTPECVEPVVR